MTRQRHADTSFAQTNTKHKQITNSLIKSKRIEDISMPAIAKQNQLYYKRFTNMYRFLLIAAALLTAATAFSPASSSFAIASRTNAGQFNRLLFMVDESSEESSSTATSLEEKMKSWEASEEEIKAATLGGVVPGGGSSEGRTDAFDVGLYIMFPVMVISCLAVSTGELFVYDVQHDQFRFY